MASGLAGEYGGPLSMCAIVAADAAVGQASCDARSVSVRNCGDPIAADPPGGRGGWGLGKPDRTVWPTARLSVADTPVPTYYDGVPEAPPPPPALAAVLEVGARTRMARPSCAA